MRNSTDKIVQKNKTHIFGQQLFFQKLCCLRDMEKYSTARQATDDNTAHAHCTLVAWIYHNVTFICTLPSRLYLYQLFLTAHENKYMKNDLVATAGHIRPMR